MERFEKRGSDFVKNLKKRKSFFHEKEISISAFFFSSKNRDLVGSKLYLIFNLIYQLDKKFPCLL